MIDHRLNFKEHLTYASGKAGSVAAALTRILSNTRGPRQTRRKIIVTVVRSILLYAAPIWAEATRFSSYLRSMESVYRICALRVCSAFRTVSSDAALVIAGTPPIDLLANENVTYDSLPLELPKSSKRRIARDRSVAVWQRRWDASQNGRWTHRLIPNLELWLNRRHGEVDYYLTQILTGHGCFKSYLHRFKHDENPFCSFCAGSVIEDAEHVFFICPKFNAERRELSNKLGRPPTVETLVDIMLNSEEDWISVCNMACAISKELRRVERLRRLTADPML